MSFIYLQRKQKMDSFNQRLLSLLCFRHRRWAFHNRSPDSILTSHRFSLAKHMRDSFRHSEILTAVNSIGWIQLCYGESFHVKNPFCPCLHFRRNYYNLLVIVSGCRIVSSSVFLLWHSSHQAWASFICHSSHEGQNRTTGPVERRWRMCRCVSWIFKHQLCFS